MPSPRFYCPLPASSFLIGEALSLPEAAAHHAARVLRLRMGDNLVLFNGESGEYVAQIHSIAKSNVSVKIVEQREIERESPITITLIQALLSSEKMDYVLQKATELGVNTISFISSQRSVSQLSPQRAEKRLEHWRQVIISACEQCGRNRVPQLTGITSFESFLSKGNIVGGLLLSPSAKLSLKTILDSPKHLTLLIGPEGGFTSQEESLAIEAGFTPLRLGSRILRAETASLAALAAIQTRFGDF